MTAVPPRCAPTDDRPDITDRSVWRARGRSGGPAGHGDHPMPPRPCPARSEQHCRCAAGGALDADRDRGTPRGAAPPTPPSIRVRTTAVRPGKQSGPLKMRQSERGEVRAGKRPIERGSTSDAPRPAVAASREDGVLRIHAAFPQLAEARAGALPLLPDDGAEAPSNPGVKASENRRRLAVAEVRPPAQQVRGQVPHNLAQAHARGPVESASGPASEIGAPSRRPSAASVGNRP